MTKITPCLWFDDQAEEAANFYVSVFKNSKLGQTVRYDDATAKAAGQPVGSILMIEFELNDSKFTALNGGSIFKFNEAISLQVYCQNQAEIDYYWEKLSAVPEAEQCGWVKDQFGLSWQIVPADMGKLLSSGDVERDRRASQALMSMKKIDIAALKAA